MFEELQNKYILSESQNEQLVLQLSQLIGELTAVKKGYKHLEKKMMHYNTLQSKYIILKERYKALERRLQEVEVGASIRSQQMSELKEQMNLKERKYKKLKEKYLEKRQELKNNGLSNSSSTNKLTRSILDSSSALDESKNRLRGRTATIGMSIIFFLGKVTH
jgi:predicted  nucleic acid-binding Zn-ribbon protein